MSPIEQSLNETRGFTLLELLVSMIMVSTMMIGTVKFFQLQSRSHAQQDQRIVMEENLRVASSMMTDALRNARYGVPSGNPSSWIPWVSGMTSNPLLTAGSGSNPDTISIAACFKKVATLSTGPGAGGIWPAGTTVLTTSTDVSGSLDSSSRRLIRIGESTEYAWVTNVSSNSITINTNPGGTAQGLQKNHPAQANICRVDVMTFSVAQSSGVWRLLRDDNQGAGAQPIADDITMLRITSTPPKQYTIALTATAEVPDPVTGVTTTRPLSTTVTLRN